MAQTTVENTSGAEKFFGFLPPHGVTLADGEVLTIDGDLRTVISAKIGRGPRWVAALDDACTNGDICLTEVAEDCCSSSSA